MNRFLIALTIAGLALVPALSGCSGDSVAQEQGTAMILPVDPAPLVITTDKGAQSFSIEIADDGAERSAGLMFREEMADDHGMLFVFENSRRVSFWMRNTPLPLDLIFIDEQGTVRAIRRGEPFSEAPIGPDVEVRYVLEVVNGVALERGISGGDKVSHPLIDANAAD